ncbi:type II secretion system secretin GspD [Nitrogeniibacter mangrovi]|uniref:Type II secretion system secretin GspD n=1 Tax=Nitrogeniibacter mangrovi TaxID=2016596 RepID=A0A6C1B6M8_9RHOO|nr:type II secretion system secretin GspD [Nitrogeniibacter mangrovi]QID19396.1 type II secretion system secretin GspD [Nitrogeniibacter mangrovi]
MDPRKLVPILVALVIAGCTPLQPPGNASTRTGWWVKPTPTKVTTAFPGESNGSPNGAKPSTEYFGTEARNASAPRTNAPSRARGSGHYQLNFQHANVKAVVDAVLGDMLKLDYVIDPAVQGELTLRTGAPISRDAVLSALESALGMVNLAMVPDGNVMRIMPLDLAPQRVRGAQRLLPYTQPRPGYAIEIIPLQFVAASEMQKLLEAMVPKGTVISADDSHGQLIVAGTRLDRAAVLRAVESFDRDAMEGMHFALYHLSQSNAEDVVAELKQIFKPPINVIGTRARLVPLPRIRAVLGISRLQTDLKTLETWIERLDANSSGDHPKLWVYQVQNGVAKDIVSSLRSVLSGREQDSAQTGTAANDVSQGRTDTATEANGSEGMTPATGGLVAVEENNSILFYGTKDEYDLIHEALSRIDVRARQVMIEAFLAEVTLNDTLRYGVQWFFDSGENAMTLSTSESGAVASQFPGFSYLYSGKADARLVLNALQSKTNVRVLSAPKLAVLNNQKATLQVGDQVPIVTQTAVSTDVAGAPIVSTVQMRDTGVILEVTPRISDSGNVTLSVSQEVSDVAVTKSSGIDSPTIQTRRLETSVATRDGYTVALGGLIRESGTKGTSGIPLLKDLPVIGNAFRDNTSEVRRTELIVLLVPHVMDDQAETQTVLESLVQGAAAAADILREAKPTDAPAKQQ